MPDETQDLLHALRDEPIDPSVLTEVRRRVMAQVETRERRMGWWWIPAALAGAIPIVLLLLVGNLDRHENLAVSRPTMPPPPAIGVTRPAPPPVRRLRRMKPKPEPLVVKMVTDDPDVVIYWLVD